jgi:hypothetical protein
MHVEDWIMLNGGASRTSSEGIKLSVDHLACIGAQDELSKLGGQKVEDRILTLHPEKVDQPLHRIGRVEIIKQATPLLRRFDLVERADAILTIEGAIGTQDIIERGMGLQKPVLPIACTGGKSREAWDHYEKDILQKFGIKKPSREYDMLITKGLDSPSELSDLVIKLIKDKLQIDLDKSKTIRPSTHLSTDKWTLEDTLGYGLIAHAIYTFLMHEETKRPLGVSIQAPWGGGKTSIMRMLQNKFDPEGPGLSIQKEKNIDRTEHITVKNLLERLKKLRNTKSDQDDPILSKAQSRAVTIWFNAWKYQTQDEFWAGLANETITQISDRLGDHRKSFLLDLHLARLGEDKIQELMDNYIRNTWWEKLRRWLPAYVGAFGLSIVITFFSMIGQFKFLFPFGEVGIIVSILGSAAITAYENVNAKKEIYNKDARTILDELIQVPDYSKKLGAEYEVEQDIRRVFQLIKKEQLSLVIFIDDLDRCSPAKISEVIEALNRFISADFEDCVFIIGVDSEFIAAALEQSYGNITKNLPYYSKEPPIGMRFMDKFIQLSVILPAPEADNVKAYVESLLIIKSKDQTSKQSSSSPEGRSLNSNQNIEDASGLSSLPSTGELVKEIKKKEEIAIAKIEETKVTYSDQNPEVRKIVMEAMNNFSDNPREMKRFLNMMRFYYFMREGRRAANLRYASLDQLRRWITLLMKWPHFVLWLERGTLSEENLQIDISSRKAVRKLEELETIGEHSWEKWQQELGKMMLQSQIPPYDNNNISWLKDQKLWLFFRNENEIKRSNPSDSLSTAKETGLF